MKEVKVICPKCNNIMTYNNWFDWVLHTPFHWFGKRRAKLLDAANALIWGD